MVKVESPSTVGRGKNSSFANKTSSHNQVVVENVELNCGNSLNLYSKWKSPNTIISDGGYGILGFAGDVSNGNALIDWYEPHIAAWSKSITKAATLWFWNSEHGWASVHNTLESYGWKYVSCNTWNKGKAHIAGNVNTKKVGHFPKVTEVCVQYVKVPTFGGLTMQKWLLHEWKRTELPLKKANVACEVADAAVRKYLDQGHLFYPPPAEKFEKLVLYANKHGKRDGRPYFSIDGKKSLTAVEWEQFKPYFNCPVGWTNVWDRNPLKGPERITAPDKKIAHLNQKPYDLNKLIIAASTRVDGVVWEPFGGLFTSALVAYHLGMKAFAAETDKDYYSLGVKRFTQKK
jgi:hypothetical protein